MYWGPDVEVEAWEKEVIEFYREKGAGKANLRWFQRLIEKI